LISDLEQGQSDCVNHVEERNRGRPGNLSGDPKRSRVPRSQPVSVPRLQCDRFPSDQTWLCRRLSLPSHRGSFRFAAWLRLRILGCWETNATLLCKPPARSDSGLESTVNAHASSPFPMACRRTVHPAAQPPLELRSPWPHHVLCPTTSRRSGRRVREKNLHDIGPVRLPSSQNGA